MKKRSRGSNPARTAEDKSVEGKSPAEAQLTSNSSKWSVPGWIRDYRFLTAILALAIPLALYEAFTEDLPTSNGEVRSEWFFDNQFDLASTLVELYPDRSQGHFLRAYQASMCRDIGFQHERCQQFPYQDLRDIQFALEEAIRQGATDQEELLHFYAFILTKVGAPPEEIEQAVLRWRLNYPYSTKPDPRQM